MYLDPFQSSRVIYSGILCPHGIISDTILGGEGLEDDFGGVAGVAVGDGGDVEASGEGYVGNVDCGERTVDCGGVDGDASQVSEGECSLSVVAGKGHYDIAIFSLIPDVTLRVGNADIIIRSVSDNIEHGTIGIDASGSIGVAGKCL